MQFDPRQAGRQLAGLRENLLRQYDAEQLHRLRVLLRRMRAELRSLRDDAAGALRRRLGKLARATGAARDWDTCYLHARTLLEPGEFAVIEDLLQARCDAARTPVYAMLASPRWAKTLRRWERHVRDRGLGDSDPALARRDLRHAASRVRQAALKALQRDGDRHWHRLRIAIKDLRYTLDSLPQSAPGAAEADRLELCKSLQSLLGHWHDTVVHRQLLAGLTGVTVPTVPPEVLQCLALLDARLVAEGREALAGARPALARLDPELAAAAATSDAQRP